MTLLIFIMQSIILTSNALKRQSLNCGVILHPMRFKEFKEIQEIQDIQEIQRVSEIQKDSMNKSYLTSYSITIVLRYFKLTQSFHLNWNVNHNR